MTSSNQEGRRIETVETRERILQAARSLFHRHGYSAVGVAELCKRSGVVKGSFYHFFPTKEELLEAVIDRNWDETQTALVRLATAPGPARDRIAAYFRGIVAKSRHMHRDDGAILGCDIGTIACELAPSPGPLQPRLRTVMRRWVKALETLIRQGQGDGSIAHDLDSKATAESLLALTQGMSVVGRTFDQPAVLARIADQALLLIPRPPG